MTVVGAKAHTFITDQTISQMAQEASDGKNERLVQLLSIFSLATRTHFFMEQEPRLCCKLLPLMESEWAAGRIDKKLVDDVTLQFIKHKVFSSGELAEDVEIVCTDGTVRVNYELLKFASLQFKTKYEAAFKEQGSKRIDYSGNYKIATVQAIKQYLYTGAFPEIKDAAILKELYLLSDYLQLSEMKTWCDTMLAEHAQKVTSEEELDILMQLFGTASDVEDALGSGIMYSALTSYLTSQKIVFEPSQEEGCIRLDVTQLGLLQDKSTLGTLLSTYTNGLIISSEAQEEVIDLLYFMPKEIREKFSEIHYGIASYSKLASRISSLFPYITTVAMPFSERHRTFGRISLDSLNEDNSGFSKIFPNLGSICYINAPLDKERNRLKIDINSSSDFEKASGLFPVTFLDYDVTLKVYHTLQNEMGNHLANFRKNYEIQGGDGIVSGYLTYTLVKKELG